MATVKSAVAHEVRVRTGAPGRPSLLSRIAPYLFIAPHLVFFLAFMAYPTLYGLFVSLHKWDLLSEPQFVGLRNYQNVFDTSTIQGTEFWPTLKATFKWVFFIVPTMIVVPLALAVLLNGKYRGRVLFRTIIYSPVVLSVATIALFWRYMLDTKLGGVNLFLVKLFGSAAEIPWFTRQPWTWIALILITMWWHAGYNMILYIAGLQEIPDHLYEAATIDGAGSWQSFWKITLPLLRPTLLFTVVMTTLGAFNMFGQAFMTTAGGPSKSTRVIMLLIHGEGFRSFRFGSASAMAWVVGVIMMVISVFQFRLLRHKDLY